MRIRPLPQLAVSLLIGLYLGMLIFRNPAERSHSHTTVKLQSKREHQSAMLANTGLGSLLSAAAFRAPPGTHQTVVMAEVNDGFYAMAYNMYKQFQVWLLVSRVQLHFRSVALMKVAAHGWYRLLCCAQCIVAHSGPWLSL